MTPCKNCGLWFLMSDEHGNLSYKQANGPTVERVRKQRLVQGPSRDMNPIWTGTRTMWSNLRVLKKVIENYSKMTLPVKIQLKNGYNIVLLHIDDIHVLGGSNTNNINHNRQKTAAL